MVPLVAVGVFLLGAVMAKLRVVGSDGNSGDVSLEEAARAALERVLAKRPEGLVIVYETGANPVAWAAVPCLNSMVRGMAIEVLDALDSDSLE